MDNYEDLDYEDGLLSEEDIDQYREDGYVDVYARVEDQYGNSEEIECMISSDANYVLEDEDSLSGVEIIFLDQPKKINNKSICYGYVTMNGEIEHGILYYRPEY